MSFHFPFSYNPYFPYNFNNYNKIPLNYQYKTNKTSPKIPTSNDYGHNNLHMNVESVSKKSKQEDLKFENSQEKANNFFLDIFGLKLQFDDLLLLVLIFFLYNEGVKDEELFIVLILLLLS